MNTEEIEKQLNWLKEEDCYEKWLMNFLQYLENSGMVNTAFEDRDSLTNFFSWDKTPEGDIFWNQLDTKFCEHTSYLYLTPSEVAQYLGITEETNPEYFI